MREEHELRQRHVNALYLSAIAMIGGWLLVQVFTNWKAAVGVALIAFGLYVLMLVRMKEIFRAQITAVRERWREEGS